jgi:hypothetical protein
LPGFSQFRSPFDQRVISKIHEIEIPFINYDDLITNKQALARSKDIEDIEQLNLRRNNPE